MTRLTLERKVGHAKCAAFALRVKSGEMLCIELTFFSLIIAIKARKMFLQEEQRRKRLQEQDAAFEAQLNNA